MGTVLQSLGLPVGAPSVIWNLERPKVVEQVHRSYLHAGAELIQTNTFGANRYTLDRHGTGGLVGELNRAGVEIARRAAGEKAAVLGGLGSTGALLRPYGDEEPERLRQVFAEQIGHLVAAGVDGLILETFFALEELQEALRAAKEIASVPIICTMAFDKGGRTVMGVGGEQAIRVLSADGADVVGANCGSGPEDMFLALSQMRQTDGEAILMAQPNAGVPKVVEGRTVFDATPEEMAEWALRFVRIGVNIIGSCCGSTNLHTAAIARAVKGKPLGWQT